MKIQQKKKLHNSCHTHLHCALVSLTPNQIIVETNNMVMRKWLQWITIKLYVAS